MVDGAQKSGIWDSMQDKGGSGLRIVSPKKSGTVSGEPDASEREKNRQKAVGLEEASTSVNGEPARAHFGYSHRQAVFVLKLM